MGVHLDIFSIADARRLAQKRLPRIIFNYVDDRVRARGIDVLPDIIEEVPTTLDFVYSRIFDVEENTLKLSLEIRNILDESYEATMADNIFYDQYDLGTSISLGLKYNF